ncbi:putative uncharacterized protein DDB_G0286901 [Plutella xylostella]|uniref:putative uncharacterized protein DDB_G0286901 n=1 Tax=Plutella xylostella TaxID=51655 RepID=UPI0020327E8A|nr:putative uncharacterized protein DDB_G0286901 [Plutella xylostella]
MKRGVANFFILVYLVSQNINAGSSQSTQTQAASSSASQTRASIPQSSSPSSLTQSSSSTNSISSQPQVVLLNNDQAKLIRPTISPNTTPNLQYVYFVDQNGNNPGINGQSINTQGGGNQPQQCNTVKYPLKTDLTALTPVVVPKNVGPCSSKSRVDNTNVPSQIQGSPSNRQNPQIQIFSADCSKSIQNQAQTPNAVKANEVRSQSQGAATVYQNVNSNNRQEANNVLYQNQAQVNTFQDINKGNNIQRSGGNVIVSQAQSQATANIFQNPSADLFVLQNQVQPNSYSASSNSNQIQGNQGTFVVSQNQQTTNINQNINNNQVPRDANVVLVRTNGQNEVNTIKGNDGIYGQSLANSNIYQNSINNPAYINLNQASSSANSITGNGGNIIVSQSQANANIQNFNNNQVSKNEPNLFFVQNQGQSANKNNGNVVLTQSQASANALQTINPNQVIGNQPNVVLTQNQAQANVYQNPYPNQMKVIIPNTVQIQNTASNNNCQQQNMNQIQVNQPLLNQVQSQDKTTVQQYSTNIVPTSYSLPQGQQQLNQLTLQNNGNAAIFSVPAQTINSFASSSQGASTSAISSSGVSSFSSVNNLQTNNVIGGPKLPTNVPCANIVQFNSVNNTQSYPQRQNNPRCNSNVPSNINYQLSPTSSNVPLYNVNGQQNIPVSSISFNPTVPQNSPPSASSFNVADRNNIVVANPNSYVTLNSNAGTQAVANQFTTQLNRNENSLSQSNNLASAVSSNVQQNIGQYLAGNTQNFQQNKLNNFNQVTTQSLSVQPNNYCNQANVKTPVVTHNQCGATSSNSKQCQEQKSVLSKIGIDKSKIPHTVSIYNGGVPTPRPQPNYNLPSPVLPGIVNNINRVNPNLCQNPASYLSQLSVANDATPIVPNVFSGCNQLPVVPISPSIAPSDLIYSNVSPVQSTPYSPCLASPPTVVSSAPVVPNLSPVNYISTISASTPVFDSYSNFVSDLVGSILSVFDPETLLQAAVDGYSPAVLTSSKSYVPSQDILVQPFEVYDQPQYIDVSPSLSLPSSNGPSSAVMPISIRLDNSCSCPTCSSSSSGCQCYDPIGSAPVLPPVIIDGDDDDDDEPSNWRDVLKLAVFNKYLSCNGGCNGVNPLVALLLAYM